MTATSEFGSIYEAINSGRYKNNVPYSIDKVPVDEDKMTVTQAKAHVEAEKQRDRDQRRLYGEEQGRLDSLFQADLEAFNDVVGNPKAGKLFGIAWQMGHSAGYSEVASHYQEMVDLIK